MSAAADALVARHLGLVYQAAHDTAARSRGQWAFTELLGFAFLGLAAAAERFDATRGLSFSTYAMPRIRGAILDGIRREGPERRGMRQKRRALQAAADARRGQGPGAAVPERTLRRWALDVLADRPASLDDRPELVGLLAAPEPDGPAVDELDCLERALDELPPRLALVLRRLYVDGQTGDAVAAELGLSASRVSQMRREAIGRLRARLAPVLRGVA